MKNFNAIINQKSFKETINDSTDSAFRNFCHEHLSIKETFSPLPSESILDTSSPQGSKQKNTQIIDNNINSIITHEPNVEMNSHYKLKTTNIKKKSSQNQIIYTPNNSHQ